MWKTSHARRHRLNASEYYNSLRPRTRTRTRARTTAPIYALALCCNLHSNYAAVNYNSGNIYASMLIYTGRIYFHFEYADYSSGNIYASILIYRSASSCRAFPTRTSSLQFW